jgi:tRNA-dihydrouridine synthase
MSVAPMMDWTDRHCRYLHRLLSRHTLLYTEMVTTGALVHGDVPRHLRFNAEEHPVALQLGGSEPADLAHCARLGEQWGYDEINLNCGCPSERVQRGAFGACLMKEPQLVADCVKAMVDVVQVPVTVKHRIGIDKDESYAFVRDFVGTVAAAGCTVFIVHARNAWLQGLSPKENREVPPLRYDVVRQLKADFPHLTIAINGGLNTDASRAGAAVPGGWRDGGPRGLPQPLVAGPLGRAVLRRRPKARSPARMWKPPWWTTWRARPQHMARPGPASRGTCWACAMDCQAHAAGARCGATIASKACRRTK